MNPNAKADKPRCDHRQHESCISIWFMAGECNDDGRHETSRGDKDDVYLRVSKEPEQMLPHDRVATLCRIKEMSTHLCQPVHREQAACKHDRRHRKYHHE